MQHSRKVQIKKKAALKAEIKKQVKSQKKVKKHRYRKTGMIS